MRLLELLAASLTGIAVLSACEPGTAPAVETSAPSAPQTGAARAPTLFLNKKTFDKNLPPNESNDLQVNLVPGTYQIYCPLDDHRNLGMLVNLTVTP